MLPGAHRAAQPPAARCAPAAIIIYTSSFARFARSATSPSFAYVINPAGQLSVQSFSCYSPIASASVAAPRSHPLQLLLPDRVRFSCYSRIASASAAAPRLRPLQLLLPDRVRFSCCSPIASASAAVPRLRPLKLATAVLEDSSPCQNATFFAESGVRGSVN